MSSLIFKPITKYLIFADSIMTTCAYRAELPAPFFYFLFTYLFSIKTSLYFHPFFSLNLNCWRPYSYNLMLTTTYMSTHLS
jgi:hypothetical protein